MTWAEIKRAVETAGIADQDEVEKIECNPFGGSKTLRRVVIGKLVRLKEAESDRTKREANGCAS